MAGWDIVDILREPVAAAIYHYTHSPEVDVFGGKNELRTMILDFGGGTFDVCAATVREKGNENKRDATIESEVAVKDNASGSTQLASAPINHADQRSILRLRRKMAREKSLRQSTSKESKDQRECRIY